MKENLYYRADAFNGRIDDLISECEPGPEPWKPSIHMPRWASRITLEIMEIRVERIQDISEVDAINEGILSVRCDAWDLKHFPDWKKKFDRAVALKMKPPIGPTPKQSFKPLWNSINAERGFAWDINPWVWVIVFRRVI
jgi:hypothetical protein